jgi:hypothetical protein
MGISRSTGSCRYPLLGSSSHHRYPRIGGSGSRVGTRPFFVRWGEPCLVIYYPASEAWDTGDRSGMIPAPAGLCQLRKQDVIHVYGECGPAIQVGYRGE